MVKRYAEFNLYASLKIFFSNLLKTLSKRGARGDDVNSAIYVTNVNMR